MPYDRPIPTPSPYSCPADNYQLPSHLCYPYSMDYRDYILPDISVRSDSIHSDSSLLDLDPAPTSSSNLIIEGIARTSSWIRSLLPIAAKSNPLDDLTAEERAMSWSPTSWMTSSPSEDGWGSWEPEQESSDGSLAESDGSAATSASSSSSPSSQPASSTTSAPRRHRGSTRFSGPMPVRVREAARASAKRACVSPPYPDPLPGFIVSRLESLLPLALSPRCRAREAAEAQRQRELNEFMHNLLAPYARSVQVFAVGYARGQTYTPTVPDVQMETVEVAGVLTRGGPWGGVQGKLRRAAGSWW
jgi:hypothetical protein